MYYNPALGEPPPIDTKYPAERVTNVENTWTGPGPTDLVPPPPAPGGKAIEPSALLPEPKAEGLFGVPWRWWIAGAVVALVVRSRSQRVVANRRRRRKN